MLREAWSFNGRESNNAVGEVSHSIFRFCNNPMPNTQKNRKLYMSNEKKHSLGILGIIYRFNTIVFQLLDKWLEMIIIRKRLLSMVQCPFC